GWRPGPGSASPGQRWAGLPPGSPAAYVEAMRFGWMLPCLSLLLPVCILLLTAVLAARQRRGRWPGGRPEVSAADHGPGRRTAGGGRPGLPQVAGRAGTGCRGAAGPGAARAAAARAAC